MRRRPRRSPGLWKYPATRFWKLHLPACAASLLVVSVLVSSTGPALSSLDRRAPYFPSILALAPLVSVGWRRRQDGEPREEVTLSR